MSGLTDRETALLIYIAGLYELPTEEVLALGMTWKGKQ